MDIKKINKALVVGLGFRTGLAVSNFLAKKGIATVVSDKKSEAELSGILNKLDSRVELRAGKQTPDLLDEEFDIVVLSPGVPKSIPLIAEAFRRGIQVISEVELAFKYLSGRIIAITGTDGKSTTTALTGHVLSKLEIDTYVGGNIGTPLISFAEKTDLSSVTVAELSSFQLETVRDFRPDVAVILNVSPDHLDRYNGMNDYFDAKLRIAHNQERGDSFIMNEDDELINSRIDDVRADILSFSLMNREADIYYYDGSVFIREGGKEKKVLFADRLKIMGMHNLQNAMASILAIKSILLKKDILPDYERIARACYSFPGLPHRMERIGSFHGRSFINDSKATTVGAVMTALKSIAGKGVLILGGRTKGDDYSRLNSSLNGKIRALVLIGESKQLFSKIFKDQRTAFADTLDDAVVEAMKMSREGDSILLSPACASFDMFENYEERGVVFKRSIKKLFEGELSWS